MQEINNLNSQYAVRPEPGNLQQFIRHSETLKHARTQFAALTRSLALSHDGRESFRRKAWQSSVRKFSCAETLHVGRREQRQRRRNATRRQRSKRNAKRNVTGRSAKRKTKTQSEAKQSKAPIYLACCSEVLLLLLHTNCSV